MYLIHEKKKKVFFQFNRYYNNLEHLYLLQLLYKQNEIIFIIHDLSILLLYYFAVCLK